MYFNKAQTSEGQAGGNAEEDDTISVSKGSAGFASHTTVKAVNKLSNGDAGKMEVDGKSIPIWTVHKELGLRHSIIMGLKGWKMHRILLIFQVILPTHLCLMKSWSLSRKHSRMMNVLQLEGTAWSYICLVLSIFGFISLVSR
jgi:ABC-type methionine transport system ATPase subunit